ncbi:hypothetical protein P691DRAFT_400246 [Macrolepiota fuliginosa MF-IS2]|uniref:Uncharacterized protein n=1 Tax=Macrolepiota fuliginosa MF-IS2 TaxID=1400762 RepID=A0A9P6C7C1_9AGAR|nr:hypothetical protein P691DRAFT_400246 [Macrolepiota fuliginosa MF-IS2]
MHFDTHHPSARTHTLLSIQCLQKVTAAILLCRLWHTGPRVTSTLSHSKSDGGNGLILAVVVSLEPHGPSTRHARRRPDPRLPCRVAPCLVLVLSYIAVIIIITSSFHIHLHTPPSPTTRVMTCIIISRRRLAYELFSHATIHPYNTSLICIFSHMHASSLASLSHLHMFSCSALTGSTAFCPHCIVLTLARRQRRQLLLVESTRSQLPPGLP